MNLMNDSLSTILGPLSDCFLIRVLGWKLSACLRPLLKLFRFFLFWVLGILDHNLVTLIIVNMMKNYLLIVLLCRRLRLLHLSLHFTNALLLDFLDYFVRTLRSWSICMQRFLSCSYLILLLKSLIRVVNSFDLNKSIWNLTWHALTLFALFAF